MVFNRNDYISSTCCDDDDEENFVNKYGDSMFGGLTVPNIVLTSSNSLTFPDGTIQITGFNSDALTEINNNINNLQNDLITTDSRVTTIDSRVITIENLTNGISYDNFFAIPIRLLFLVSEAKTWSSFSSLSNLELANSFAY